MAEGQRQAPASESQSDPYLDHLRVVAQSHLQEIEKEKEEEQEQLSQAERDIIRYSKPSKKARSKTSIPTTYASEEKGPKLRSAPDVLDRLRWDPAINLSDYVIGYFERFEGMKEMPASSWIQEPTEEEWIPQHRIKYVKKLNKDGTNEIVWDRDARVDKIFGRRFEIPDGSIDGSTAGGVEI